MNNLTKETEIYKNQIEQWIKTLGLPQHQPESNEIEAILGLNRSELQEKSSTELSENVVILSQYALFLQQKANECSTFLKWSGQISNRITNNDRPRLVKWIRNIELRLERIQYLARKIELISQSINNLVRARYYENR